MHGIGVQANWEDFFLSAYTFAAYRDFCTVLGSTRIKSNLLSSSWFYLLQEEREKKSITPLQIVVNTKIPAR